MNYKSNLCNTKKIILTSLYLSMFTYIPSYAVTYNIDPIITEGQVIYENGNGTFGKYFVDSNGKLQENIPAGGAMSQIVVSNKDGHELILNEYKSYIFRNNNAVAGGGAIFNEDDWDNTTVWGGGGTPIITFGDNQIIKFINNTVSNSFNTDTYASGGAIFNVANYYGSKSSIVFGINDEVLFSGNSAQKFGGAIFNLADHYDNRIAIISFGDNSNITFLNNKAETGGAIYNSAGGRETANAEVQFGNYTHSKFTNNSATNKGGAIYNDGDLGKISGTFSGNNVISSDKSITPLGGAIYTTKDITIYSDGDNENTKITEFKGNYVSQGDDKIDNAIWVETENTQVGKNPTIILQSLNTGSIQFDDQIDGGKVDGTTITRNGYQYNLKIQGDNTSKVILNNSVINANASLTDTNLYISETAFADTRTNLNANSGTVHFANGKSENYQINQLTSLESVNYTVDVDLTKLAPVPDTISTGEGSSGTVTISDINFNGELKDFNAQILKAQDDNIQLGLSDNLKDKYNTTSTETIHTNDTVQANVNWKDKFNKYEQTNTTTTGLSLGTTNTTNDSIEYLTKTTEGEKIYQVQWAIR